MISGVPSSSRGRGAISISSPARSRISAPSANRSAACSRRSIWARTSVPTPNEETEQSDDQQAGGDDTEAFEGQRDESADAAQAQTSEAGEADSDTEVEAADASSGEFEAEEEGDLGEGDQAADAHRPPPRTRPEARAPDYQAFTHKFDETIAAEALCEPEELERLRAYLDKQLQNLSSVVGRLANRLQRRLLAQQNRSWEFDLEEGMLVPRGCRASSSTRSSRSPSSARRTWTSAIRW